MILEVTPEIDKKTKDTIVKEIYAEYGCPLFFGAKNKNFDVPVDRFLQQLCKKYNLERISIRNVGSSDELHSKKKSQDKWRAKNGYKTDIQHLATSDGYYACTNTWQTTSFKFALDIKEIDCKKCLNIIKKTDPNNIKKGKNGRIFLDKVTP